MMAMIQNSKTNKKKKQKQGKEHREGITLTFNLIDVFYEKWMKTDTFTPLEVLL